MAVTSNNPGVWPRWMRAATAAAYVDESSVEAFRRKVGAVYPMPTIGKGRSARWDREEIDFVCGRKAATTIVDAASVL